MSMRPASAAAGGAASSPAAPPAAAAAAAAPPARPAAAPAAGAGGEGEAAPAAAPYISSRASIALRFRFEWIRALAAGEDMAPAHPLPMRTAAPPVGQCSSSRAASSSLPAGSQPECSLRVAGFQQNAAPHYTVGNRTAAERATHARLQRRERRVRDQAEPVCDRSRSRSRSSWSRSRSRSWRVCWQARSDGQLRRVCCRPSGG